MAQLVKYPTSAQVIISQLVGLSPASGSGLTGQSLEPASESVSPSLSPLPPLIFLLSFSVSLSLSHEHLKKNNRVRVLFLSP